MKTKLWWNNSGVTRGCAARGGPKTATPSFSKSFSTIKQKVTDSVCVNNQSRNCAVKRSIFDDSTEQLSLFQLKMLKVSVNFLKIVTILSRRVYDNRMIPVEDKCVCMSTRLRKLGIYSKQ